MFKGMSQESLTYMIFFTEILTGDSGLCQPSKLTVTDAVCSMLGFGFRM